MAYHQFSPLDMICHWIFNILIYFNDPYNIHIISISYPIYIYIPYHIHYFTYPTYYPQIQWLIWFHIMIYCVISYKCMLYGISNIFRHTIWIEQNLDLSHIWTIYRNKLLNSWRPVGQNFRPRKRIGSMKNHAISNPDPLSPKSS